MGEKIRLNYILCRYKILYVHYKQILTFTANVYLTLIQCQVLSLVLCNFCGSRVLLSKKIVSGRGTYL